VIICRSDPAVQALARKLLETPICFGLERADGKTFAYHGIKDCPCAISEKHACLSPLDMAMIFQLDDQGASLDPIFDIVYERKMSDPTGIMTSIDTERREIIMSPKPSTTK